MGPKLPGAEKSKFGARAACSNRRSRRSLPQQGFCPPRQGLPRRSPPPTPQGGAGRSSRWVSAFQKIPCESPSLDVSGRSIGSGLPRTGKWAWALPWPESWEPPSHAQREEQGGSRPIPAGFLSSPPPSSRRAPRRSRALRLAARSRRGPPPRSRCPRSPPPPPPLQTRVCVSLCSHHLPREEGKSTSKHRPLASPADGCPRAFGEGAGKELSLVRARSGFPYPMGARTA